MAMLTVRFAIGFESVLGGREFAEDADRPGRPRISLTKMFAVWRGHVPYEGQTEDHRRLLRTGNVSRVRPPLFEKFNVSWVNVRREPRVLDRHGSLIRDESRIPLVNPEIEGKAKQWRQ